ncbi:hypothetical protein K431DRAFT_283483 [Polychaeton citri CBS 116435]|uniref:Elongation factor 2 n=1 Tax=Polychaeton citri CBS 116435 TaxID=1314669 RepID=A0A9P4QB70_9PEZI|nr:hypothetical protein K431DRAFT_283483 [Polychaeton citri CBS 116435]
MANGLTAQPLGPQGGFNWVFLVEILVCGILAVFFLFYFNRLFATVISYAVRAFSWHYYRAYVDITSLQISLLGGRLFFKRIRYHAHNETILVHDGHITWRYWLRQVQDAQIFEELDEEDGERSSLDEDSSTNEKEKGGKGKEGRQGRSADNAERGTTKAKKELPCRISIKVSGVEAFIYNRSPLYDGIVEQTQKMAQTPPNSAGNDYATAESVESVDRRSSDSASSNSDSEKSRGIADVLTRKFSQGTAQVSTIIRNLGSERRSKQLQIPSWIRILPVKLECKKAAAALGNENTTSIITVKVENGAGTIDAGKAGPLDYYKLLFNFELKKIKVEMKPNRDFKQYQLDAAQHLLQKREAGLDHLERTRTQFPPPFLLPYFEKLGKWLKLAGSKGDSGSLKTASMRSDEFVDEKGIPGEQIPGESQWHGLERYLDDGLHDEHDEWQDIEYAKASTLLDCGKLGMLFYWDIPGVLPDATAGEDANLLGGGRVNQPHADINGSEPPAYGLDLLVYGGTIVYGPWADRQRMNLQKIFVPQAYVNSTPQRPLRAGDTRLNTVFKIFIAIEEDVVLRIPMREPSKDLEWQGRASPNKLSEKTTNNSNGKEGGKRGRKRRHGKRGKFGKKNTPPGADVRPYAWLDITVKRDSTVTYTMDMFARSNGFNNSLDLDVKGTEISSSVNHGLLWRAGHLTMFADLSNPLTWNTLRRWPFKITCDHLELFILRDHMFLITDLVNDWSSGPPPEFWTFVPYRYEMDINFRNFCMFLNVNDANVINEPAELSRNYYLTIEGQSLSGVLGIPLEHYRPKKGGVTFDVLSQNMKMRMLNPPRSTFYDLVKDNNVAELPRLTLKGNYESNTESAPGLTDVLRMDLVGTGLSLKAYGFLMRYFINVKQNYFGDYMHFKTLEEFQDASENMLEANAKTASMPQPSTNELDVVLCIIAEEITVMAPTTLYSIDNFVKVDLPLANIDLRITSYYMDLVLNFSPVSILSGSKQIDDDPENPLEDSSGTQIYIAGVDLLGHRLFGLAPSEPAYVNDWEVDVGAITGECTSGFIKHLAFAARAFVFTFADGENIWPLGDPYIIHDMVFLQLRTDILKIWMHVGKEALLISTQPVSVDFNDWARDLFSQHLSVLVPDLTIACVDGRSASRHRAVEGRQKPVRTYAFLQTSVQMGMVGRKRNFTEERGHQQAHLQKHDQRTRRALFLQHRRPQIRATLELESDVDPPNLPYPSLPPPLRPGDTRTPKAASIGSESSVRSQSSASSVASKSSKSSLSRSIRGGALAVPFRALNKSSREPSRHGRSQSQVSSRSSTSGLSTPDDFERATFGLPPSTVAFSSTFAEPYFPLDTIKPDESEVPVFDADTSADEEDELPEDLAGAIHDREKDETAEHITIFIKVVPGIRAYAEPRVAETAAKILKVLQPKQPETVLDAFQVDVMNTISANQASHHKIATVIEIQATVPALKLRAANPFDPGQTGDYVDLDMRGIGLMLRQRSKAAHSKQEDSLAMHITLGSLNVSLRETAKTAPRKPAIEASIDDALVWITLAGAQSLHVSTRGIAAKANSSQADYFAAFLLRVLGLVKDLEPKFKKPLETEQKRLHVLIQTLTRSSRDVGDPTFMSKLNYILRAFPDHYRNQESWKVLSRFRRMLQEMPVKILDDLKNQFKEDEIICSHHTPAEITEILSQWRNWDVPNVNHTIAFEKLFGPDDDRAFRPASPSQPVAMTWRTEHLEIAIDDDPKAADVVIEDISVALEKMPPSMPTGLMLVEDNKRSKLMLQVHSSSISFGFDWSVYNVAESMLSRKDKFQSLMRSSQAQSAEELREPRSKSQALNDEIDRHDFHIAVSTDQANLQLTTINLRHKSQAQGMRLSLIGTTQSPDENFGNCASALLNADTATTELYGQDRCIWQTLMTSPSLYFDQVQPYEVTGLPPSVTLAMAYEELQVQLKDEIVGILHIVDSVIEDEVKAIERLVNMGNVNRIEAVSEEKQKKRELKVARAASNTRPKVHAVVMAGSLQLEVALLSSLSYRLESKSTRLRVAPNLTVKNTFSIDVEVADQSHAFINTSNNSRQEQGLLHVPPINGHVGLQLADDKTQLNVTTTVQEIRVDASAISGLISIINKPEMTEVFKEAKTSIEEITEHAKALEFGDPHAKHTQEEQNPKVPILFETRLALLGLKIGAVTPHVANHSEAALELGIGPLHALASNIDSNTDDGQVRIFDVRAQVKDVGISLAIHEKDRRLHCGNLTLGVITHFNAHKDADAKVVRELTILVPHIEVNAFPETAALAVDVINHMQDRIKDLDLSRELEYLRRLRHGSRAKATMPKIRKHSIGTESEDDENVGFSASDLLSISVSLKIRDVQICWLVATTYAIKPNAPVQDPVLTIAAIDLTAEGGDKARLTIQNILLQLVPKGKSKQARYLNSALIPLVSFSVAYWSEGQNKSFAFKATGKPLDLRLESKFMLPIGAVQRSVEAAIEQFRTGTATWQNTPTSSGAPRAKLFGKARLASVLVEVDFAGARVYLQGSALPKPSQLSMASAAAQQNPAPYGRYGQFAAPEEAMHTALVAPGIAFKIQYEDSDTQPFVSAEVMVEASNNMLLPNVVPLVLEVSRSVKEVLQAQDSGNNRKQSTPPEEKQKQQQRFSEDTIVKADPEALFGKTRINLGLRICRQEFGLTCQPITKVDAKAELEDFYLTMNTIDSDEHGRFFALSAVVTKLAASVKHVYSREPTFSFDMKSIVLSLMNSKHLSGVNGVSAILKIDPTQTRINAKQLQDVLVFREIWLPPEIRNAQSSPQPSVPRNSTTDDFLMQKFQSVSAAAPFPWNATVLISELAVDLDMGQSIGKSSFTITGLWASSQKTSNWEQNLCIGLDEMAMKSTGRMSGFISLEKLGVRTMIKWPQDSPKFSRNPLIQASMGFQRLRAKAAFDYQAFAFVDIEDFDFLMYNVREPKGKGKDRLVATLDGQRTYAFLTSTSAAQALGLYQAFERLIDEKQKAYKQSIQEIEQHVRRESIPMPKSFGPKAEKLAVSARKSDKASISLHTDVVVTLGTICVGAFPSTFFDSQILKLEATNIQARFAVGMEKGRIHSGLGMTLGQLQVALASVKKVAVPKTLGDISIDDVIASAVNSKGGTILRVPKVIASMQTWQYPDSISIDYLFRSLFEGKIDVGWNLSRINFIKNMWMAGHKALTSRLGGRQLPESAVKIRPATQSDDDNEKPEDGKAGIGATISSAVDAATTSKPQSQEKITAEVNLPTSKYEYNALEPPIIETPQLRDMGEATPPLEWIGLHRDRLPNVTHQIIIVSLLEVAKEVEDAYERILGSS